MKRIVGRFRGGCQWLYLTDNGDKMTKRNVSLGLMSNNVKPYHISEIVFYTKPVWCETSSQWKERVSLTKAFKKLMFINEFGSDMIADSENEEEK